MKRFKLFLNLLNYDTGNKILDIGGFGNSLEILDKNFINNNDVTILNIENVEVNNKNIKFVLGDATDASLFPRNCFDIVYCNSVIEHVGTLEQQKKLSDNIRYWGKKYFVQTPNYYFPIEPHFLIPLFQFMPIRFRANILNKFNLGSYPRELKYKDALKVVSSVRLIKKEKFQSLFPGAKLFKEKFLFLSKSFIVHNFD